MPESPDLVAELKASSNEIQQYVAALKAENAKLHRRIAKLEAENISLENRIDAIKGGDIDPSLANLSEDEILKSVRAAAEQFGYTLIKK